ncbi:MAG TPA: hypothetical protein VF461_05700 [Gemmatimonadaceae bacterium]
MAFPTWSTQACSRSGAWFSAALICAMRAIAPAGALAQSVSGSISVSATVLPPIMMPAVKPVSFRVERNGVAQLETTPPYYGAVSAIVMSTVSSSANGFIPVARPPALVKATRGNALFEATRSAADSVASRWRYEIPLDATPGRTEPHDVIVRITYLIVPGT